MESYLSDERPEGVPLVLTTNVSEYCKTEIYRNNKIQ